MRQAATVTTATTFNGVAAGGSPGPCPMRDLTVRRTVATSILIENASNVTVEGSTIEDFARAGAGDVWRAGIAPWYSSDITLTNNTIEFRASGSPCGHNDGIWFKSNESHPGPSAARKVSTSAHRPFDAGGSCG